MIGMTLAVLAQAAAAHPCLKDGDRVSGEFRYVETRHHDQQIHQAFVVTEQFCFAPVIWRSETPIQGRWIQVHWSDKGARDPRPGDAVTMVVQDCHEPGTAWHIGDIVCDARLVSREPM